MQTAVCKSGEKKQRSPSEKEKNERTPVKAIKEETQSVEGNESYVQHDSQSTDEVKQTL